MVFWVTRIKELEIIMNYLKIALIAILASSTLGAMEAPEQPKKRKLEEISTEVDSSSITFTYEGTVIATILKKYLEAAPALKYMCEEATDTTIEIPESMIKDLQMIAPYFKY